MSKKAEAMMIIPMLFSAVSGAIVGVLVGWRCLSRIQYRDKVVTKKVYQLNEDTIKAWCNASGKRIADRSALMDEWQRGYEQGRKDAVSRMNVGF